MPAGERRYTRHDLDGRPAAARRAIATGVVYFSATPLRGRQRRRQLRVPRRRAATTRTTSIPHEHRRELRGQPGVRGLAGARRLARAQHAQHPACGRANAATSSTYMYDFGAILGSATRFPDPPISNHEYLRGGPLEPGRAASRWGCARRPRSACPCHMTSPRQRRLRERDVRPAALEGQLPERGLRQHAARRRLLGRPAGLALLRRGDSRPSSRRPTTTTRPHVSYLTGALSRAPRQGRPGVAARRSTRWPT